MRSPAIAPSSVSRCLTSRRWVLGLGPLVMAPLGLVVAPQDGAGQWTNRYPRVAGYGHHVYLEGYELPTLTAGPIDPAPSPDGERVAFASRGWIWVMDLSSGVARRLTRGGGSTRGPPGLPTGSSSRSCTTIPVQEAGRGERRP